MISLKNNSIIKRNVIDYFFFTVIVSDRIISDKFRTSFYVAIINQKIFIDTLTRLIASDKGFLATIND